MHLSAMKAAEREHQEISPESCKKDASLAVKIGSRARKQQVDTIEGITNDFITKHNICFAHDAKR